MTATVENPQTLTDATALLPLLRALKNNEKLFLIQFLASELSLEEQAFPMSTYQTHYVWSPYDSTEAAQTLMQFLKRTEGSKSS
jgi:hypothetical protein